MSLERVVIGALTLRAPQPLIDKRGLSLVRQSLLQSHETVAASFE
jgi:hypothetical protein